MIKKYFYSVLVLAISSVTVEATEISNKCYKNAEMFTEKFAASENYDADAFNAFQCILASNRSVVICDVSAFKGNGDGVDTYRIVMNLSCTRAVRVEITGEE